MKKALSLALALALCMGLFSGCGTETGSNSTSQPAQSSGETVKTVTWASTSDITGLDPRNGNSTITASILASLYSTLVKTDPQGRSCATLLRAMSRWMTLPGTSLCGRTCTLPTAPR